MFDWCSWVTCNMLLCWTVTFCHFCCCFCSTYILYSQLLEWAFLWLESYIESGLPTRITTLMLDFSSSLFFLVFFVFGAKCMPVVLFLTGDIHKHLYSMCGLLRPSDNIKLVSFCTCFVYFSAVTLATFFCVNKVWIRIILCYFDIKKGSSENYSSAWPCLNL